MYGYIVVITRNGSLGGRYPLVSSECLFGQSPNCDVRVYVANVAPKHCLITALPNEKAYIRNLSASNTTLVNSIPIGADQWQLEHADVITVGDRHFRWEYPPSSCPPATPKHIEKTNSPACMVQVPLSVFKNKRHSTTGLVKEKVSISSQVDEPIPKRRKTIHNTTDIGIENQLSKPVNKHLQALTQPASSPKSFKTFKVLLKSASKKKSMTPVSKTPTSKKISSVKVKRSLSDSRPKSVLKSSTLPTNTPKKSEMATPKRKSQNISPARASKSPKVSKLPKDNFKTKISPQKLLKLTKLDSPFGKNTTIKSRKTLSPVKRDSKRQKISRKSLPASFKVPAKGSKTPKIMKTPKVRKLLAKHSSPLISPKGRTPKTPAGVKLQKNISPSNTPRTYKQKKLSLRKTLNTSSRKSSPVKPVSPAKTPRGQPLSRKSSPVKSVSITKTPRGRPPKTPQLVESPAKTVSPSKTPRGRSPKTIEVRSSSRNTSPVNSGSPPKTLKDRTPIDPQVGKQASRESSPVKPVSPAKTPRGQPLSRKSSPVKSVSTTKTPRGRPPKTPQSVESSPSPAKTISPSRTPRGRPLNTGGKRSASINSSPAKSVSPAKTPRGRTPKDPQVTKPSRESSSLKSISPAKTPRGRPRSRKSSPVKSVSTTKTPRGRPPKTPQLVESPANTVSPSKTSRGRPPKTIEERSSSRNTSPVNSGSPAKTPKDRTPIDPQVGKQQASRESSPVKPVSPAKTPRGQPLSRKSSPVKSVSTTKTPRGRPPKTPQLVESPPSPAKTISPSRTPRGRPLNTEGKRSASINSSPAKSVSPVKTPRGRTPKDPQVTKPSRESSPVKPISTATTPRGRPRFRSSSPVKSVSTTKTPKSSSSPETTVSPSKTPRGRPPKSEEERSSSKNSSPGSSGSLTKTPRDRTPIDPQVAKQQSSRESSPVKLGSPTKTPRGRTPKTPQLVKPANEPLSDKSPSPAKDLRGRSPKAQGEGRLSSRNTSPAKSVSPTKTPSFKTPKTPVKALETHSLRLGTPGGSLETPEVRKASSRSSSPVKTVSSSSALRGMSPKISLVEGTSSMALSFTVNDTSSVNSPPMAKESSNDTNTMRSLRKSHANEKEVFVFKATPKPKHNRASILRTSLHHDLSAIHDIEKLFSEERSRTPSIASTSTNPLSSTRNNRSSLKPRSENPKRKFSDDIEAKAELAAKKLKMETPKSLSKKKMAAIMVCHRRSPIRKPLLFSEVLKHRLSETKRKPTQLMPARPVTKKLAKPKLFKPSTEVPKSFNFNSTGHANSPETIVIRKKIAKTPLVKTQLRRGKKAKSMVLQKPSTSKEALEGVPELFKTPSKAKVSSMKSATSVKKDPNVRVRFSLHNNVQSPSGRSSLVPHTDEIPLPGSPMVSSKKYVRTPRLIRSSLGARASLLHTSIVEESPLAQDIESPRETRTSASPSKSSERLSKQSHDFSVYSPSSPTLNLSKISNLSPLAARKSINFDSFEGESEGEESPHASPSHTKAKRGSNASLMFDLSHSSSASPLNVNQTGNLFEAAATSSVSGSLKRKRSMDDSYKQSPSEGYSTNTFNTSRSSRKLSVCQKFQPSPNQNALLSTSDLNSSSRVTRVSLKSTFNSPNDPSNSLLSSMSTKSPRNNVSQIPLPPSSSWVTLSKEHKSTPSSSRSSETVRSTRLQHSIQKSSKMDFLTIFQNLDNYELSKSTRCYSATKEQAGTNRVSSTPKSRNSNIEKSPVSSPILSSDRQSRSSSSSYTNITYNQDEGEHNYNTQTTSGRKSKQSTRMSASNSNHQTPESQLPVAAVKPSTRMKQGNESTISSSRSVSLPNLSNSHDVSGRSLDQSLSRKIIDSRFSDSLSQVAPHQTFSQRSSVENNSYSGSGRRKRKSSILNSPKSIGNISFDFSLVATPRVPRDVFISPLEEPHDSLSGVKRILNPIANSPVSSYVNVKGVKRLMKTPKMSPDYISTEGIKGLFKQTPSANYSDVEGLKRLYNLTPEANYMNIKGVRRIFKEPKSLDSPDVAGLEILFESPQKVIDDSSEPSTSKPVGKVTPMTRTKSDKAVNGAGSQEEQIQVNRTDTNRTRSPKGLPPRRTRQTAITQDHQTPLEKKTRTNRKLAAQNNSQGQEQEVRQNVVLEDDDKSALMKKTTRGRKACVQKKPEAEKSQERIAELQEDQISPEIKTRRGRKVPVKNNSEAQEDVASSITQPNQNLLEKKTRGRGKAVENESDIKESDNLQTESQKSSESVLRKNTRCAKKEETISKHTLVTESRTDEQSVGVATKKRTRGQTESLVKEETSTLTRGRRNTGKAKEEALKDNKKSKKSSEPQHETLNLPEVKNARKVRACNSEQDENVSSQGSTLNQLSMEESNLSAKRRGKHTKSEDIVKKNGKKVGKRPSNCNMAELSKTSSPPKKARKGRKQSEEMQQLAKITKQDEPSSSSVVKNSSTRATRAKKSAPKQSPNKIEQVAPSTSEESPNRGQRKEQTPNNTKMSKTVKKIKIQEETSQVETNSTTEVRSTRSRTTKVESVKPTDRKETNIEEVQSRNSTKRKGKTSSTSKVEVKVDETEQEVSRTAKLEERLKEDTILVQKSAKVNKSEKSESSQRHHTKRVQFNTSLKTPRKSLNKKQTTLKTKAATKLKASSKKKSISPKKSPLAKRVTRSRK